MIILAVVFTLMHLADRPDLDNWMMGLQSTKGPCCSFADATTVRDPDWDSLNGHYRVRLNGDWVEVPDGAIVKDINRYGAAIVWTYKEIDGSTKIRCFIAGAGA